MTFGRTPLRVKLSDKTRIASLPQHKAPVPDRPESPRSAGRVLIFSPSTRIPTDALIVRASGASPIVLNPSLGSRTSIGNSAPRAGNSSLPQLGYRLEPQ